MQLAFTIDLEDWYVSHDFNFKHDTFGKFENRLTIGTNKLLELLDKHKRKATFFVLGYSALQNPDLIKKIASKGHELGSHGMYHRKISELTASEFLSDVSESKTIIEGISGAPCEHFRAPSWSVGKNTSWYLEILEKCGFICDSSIQPFKTPLSGHFGLPPFPFKPIINGKQLDIIEFPQTTIGYGIFRLPFSGGLYLRCLPQFFIETALDIAAKNNPAMVYTHPWELDLLQPKLKNTFLINFTHYYNISKTEVKLDMLLSKYNFSSLGDIIRKVELKYKCIF